MDQIEEVRNKTDIVQLISEAVSLKKAGRNFRGLCPFHDEKTPSFMVSPERQMWKCFGCGKGGDVFKFVMERERLEFGEALRLLADRAGIELKQYRPNPQEKLKEKLLEINHLASEYYHYLLTEHKSGKEALDYLLKRGVTKSSIATFKLGFAPSAWGSLERYLVGKKKYSNEDMEAAGLGIKGQKGYYDRFRGRVIFPLFDVRGRVVGFSGRVLDPDAKEAKYVNSPETMLYHKSDILYGMETTKEAIKKANKAVVVEGELDMISSYQAGVTNVVAIKGSALTESQLDLLKRFCDNLILSLDMDTAGDAANRRGIELAENKGLNVRVIRLQFGKDPDECARHSAKMWHDSVKAAVPVYDFYIESSVRRFGTDTPEGKRQISDELSPILAKISNSVILSHYLKKLAQILGVSEEAVSEEVTKGQRLGERVKSVKPAAAPPLPESRQERFEQYLLSLVLPLGESALEPLTRLEPAWLDNSASAQAVMKLKAWLKGNKKPDINKFVATLPEELVAAVDQAYLTDLKDLNDDEQALTDEAIKTVYELKQMAVKAKLNQLSEAIKQAEADRDKEKVRKLQRQFLEESKILGYNHI